MDDVEGMKMATPILDVAVPTDGTDEDDDTTVSPLKPTTPHNSKISKYTLSPDASENASDGSSVVLLPTKEASASISSPMKPKKLASASGTKSKCRFSSKPDDEYETVVSFSQALDFYSNI